MKCREARRAAGDRRRLALWVGAVLALVAWSGAALGRVSGDANCDAALDESDILANVGAIFEERALCSEADVNLDWKVNAADLAAVAQRLGSNSHLASGPRIPFFGLAGADGAVLLPVGVHNGAALYTRSSGFGVRIVVEGQIGASNVRPGTGLFHPSTGNPLLRPDVQIESNRSLGDGSGLPCEGGIPAVAPATFAPGQAVTDALNDFACSGAAWTAAAFACTQDAFGNPSFVSVAPFVQYCFQVSRDMSFPPGDTVLTARLRDLLGNLGPEERMIVRVASGPFPPTFTPTATLAPASPLASRTPTPTRSVTLTPTLVPSFTRTRTRTPPPSSTPTLAEASPTRTYTSRPPTVTPTGSLGPPTRTPTRTPTQAHSFTPTLMPSPTATVTQGTLETGPVVLYLGLTLADDTLLDPTRVLPNGIPVFEVARGTGFAIVVEGRRGSSGAKPGCSSYREALDGSDIACETYLGDSPLPDFLVVASHPLGNGSEEVCDTRGSAGGVPAVDPPLFTDEQAAAINDFSCRFVDGLGKAQSRSAADGCVSFPSRPGDSGYVRDDAEVQFCSAKVSRNMELPAGETTLTVRLRDVEGNLGPSAALLIVVGG